MSGPVMTLAEAAQALGVSAATLRQQVARGKLRASKIGPVWTVRRVEVARYHAESLGRPGRRRAVPSPKGGRPGA